MEPSNNNTKGAFDILSNCFLFGCKGLLCLFSWLGECGAEDGPGWIDTVH